MLTGVHALAERIGASARRVLVRSANPELILTTLVAGLAMDCDVVFAHATLAPEFVIKVATELNVAVSIEETGEVRLTRVSSEASGTVFLMTSGTTGLPKLAQHRFEQLLDRILPSALLPVNRNGQWLLTYPPTTFAGLQVLLTACLTDGALIVPAERTPAGFAEAAMTHSVTHLSGTPTFWRSFLMAVNPGRLAELRQITVGGEAVDQSTLDRLRVAFPKARITHIYASTEGGALFAVSDARAGFPAAWLDSGVQGIRLRIREGCLEVLSPRRMVGFLAKGHTNPSLEDGWLATSDLVRVDGDRVVFLGRGDSLINVGGYKVYPQEIEGYLLGLPGIVETRVRAVANPLSGQALVAEIVVSVDQDPDLVRREAMATCRRDLPRHQVPAMIRVVPAIAIAESGKKQ
ncbi:MAG: fatty acid--CoA ligase family protein [Nitrospira sp.]|nr:fatty acid--CoA ligase family protein [Nitrospira sp.]